MVYGSLSALSAPALNKYVLQKGWPRLARDHPYATRSGFSSLSFATGKSNAAAGL